MNNNFDMCEYDKPTCDDLPVDDMPSKLALEDVVAEDDANEPEELRLADENDALGDEMSAESAGWPGDGSGEDDFQDFNANDADDYRDE